MLMLCLFYLLWKHLRAGIGFILCLRSTECASFAIWTGYVTRSLEALSLCCSWNLLDYSYFLEGTEIIPLPYWGGEADDSKEE